jgi:predicted metal-dependent hydrolase
MKETLKKMEPSKSKNSDWPVEIIRSQKRRKTVSAELKDGTLVVRAPQAMSDAELGPIIENLQKRLARQIEKRHAPHTDDDLEQLARQLNNQYFKGNLHWQSIRYVTNQNKRFGSCTPSQGTIRISHRLAKMPRWVLKYVVMHELAHLKEANHGPRFWKLVNRYALTERARGYLMAVGLEDLSDD